MSLFTRYDVNEEFPEDCNTIWTYINLKGTPKFTRYELDALWRAFSSDCFCAQFMIPHEHIMIEFMDWLENR